MRLATKGLVTELIAVGSYCQQSSLLPFCAEARLPTASTTRQARDSYLLRQTRTSITITPRLARA
jgi:hypothetical protein